MMTSASAATTSTTTDAKGLTHFTFWDVDDTLIVILKRIFKNAHLLLPTMLYQTRSPNQHFGILTNRSFDDEARSDFPVEICLQILSGFGIDVPKAHVLFGGGEDNKLNGDDHHHLSIATKEIIRQLEMLNLTDHSEGVLRTQALVNLLDNEIAPLQDLKHRGKNYFILKFLERHFNKLAREYRFETGVCHKDSFMCGIVDDKKGIPESAAMLGKCFFGIKATDGGYPPKSAVDRPDFYQDDYLFVLARQIGLDAYAKSLLSNPEEHATEDALLQLSGYLYAWQAFPGILTIKHFAKFEHCLSLDECEQIANMLAYIKCNHNQHVDAHYTSVDDLAESFKTFAIKKSLTTLNGIRDQITALNAQLVTLAVPSASTVEPVKGVGRLGMLFKSKSMGGASRALPVGRMLAPEDAARLSELSQTETMLAMRLTHLQQEDFDGVRQPVRIAFGQAIARAQAAANPYGMMMPLSMTSSTTGSRISARGSSIPTSSSSQDSTIVPVAPVLITPAVPPVLISRSSSRSNEDAASEEDPSSSVAPSSSARRSGSAIIGRRSGKK